MKTMILLSLLVLSGCATGVGHFQTRYMALCGLTVEVVVDTYNDSLNNAGIFPAEITGSTPEDGLIAVCPGNGTGAWGGIYRSSAQSTCGFRSPVVSPDTFTIPAGFADCI